MFSLLPDASARSNTEGIVLFGEQKGNTANDLLLER